MIIFWIYVDSFYLIIRLFIQTQENNWLCLINMDDLLYNLIGYVVFDFVKAKWLRIWK